MRYIFIKEPLSIYLYNLITLLYKLYKPQKVKMENQYSLNYKECYNTRHIAEKVYQNNDNDNQIISLERSPFDVDEVLFSTSSKKNTKTDSRDLVKYRKISLGLDFSRTENFIKIRNHHKELREKHIAEIRKQSINENKEILNQIMHILKRDDRSISLNSFGLTENDFLSIKSLVGSTKQMLNSLKPVNYLSFKKSGNLPPVRPHRFNFLNNEKTRIFPTELNVKTPNELKASRYAIPKEITLEDSDQLKRSKSKEKIHNKFIILKAKNSALKQVNQDLVDKCSIVDLDPSKFIPKSQEVYKKIGVKDFMALGRLINKPFK